MYSKFKKYLLNILSKFLIVLFWGMCIVVFMGVIFRFIKKPLVWAEEYALISMVWLTFIGAGIVYEYNSHLAVDLLLVVLPKKSSKVIELITDIIVFPFFVALIIGGAIMVNITKNSITPALNISVAFQYLPALVGGLIMLMFNVEKIITKIKGLRRENCVEGRIN
ncbi:TRAP transporter small permease [Tissierella praeacuta]|uniref:TRAP transporter small permease n=1 Tax=Tissierella praeacuta TaxID=43131 RepID=UPI002899ECEF|nr:TRAP transporter small permease [Tissierella praeacuta]